MPELTVAVVGATGLVGQEMLKVLEQRNFPVKKLRAFATSRSEGTKVAFQGREVVVEDIEKVTFRGIQCALFSGGEVASAVYAPEAAKEGCVVIDNSATFRMEPHVPLVVPEVNPDAVASHRGIIANPNCSTIQMVVVLKPIYDAVGIKRVVVSTYQSVSGTGRDAVTELMDQLRALLRGEKLQHTIYPHQIALNVLPHIGGFEIDGYTREEKKMVLETKKIMEDDSIQVSATTVRVPVIAGHSEAVNIETRKKLTARKARLLLSKAPGVMLVDDPEKNIYPLPIDCAGKDEVLVGRIREDTSIARGLDLWIAADNLRKGAALNAVQIAELLMKKGLLGK